MQEFAEQGLELPPSLWSVPQHRTNSALRHTHLVQIMRPVGQALVHSDDNPIDLVPARPLRIARVAVDPPDVLRDLGRDGREQPAVDWVERVGEDELGPSEDTELVARCVEVVPARELV